MTTISATVPETQPSRKPRRLHSFPIISLLLIAAVGAMWIRSYHRSDTLLVCLHRGVAQGIVTDQGRFCLFMSNVELGRERQWTLVHWSQEAGAGQEAAAAIESDIDLKKSKFGFMIGASKKDAQGITGGKFYFLAAPDWAPLALLAIPFLLFLRLVMRDRKRLRRGLCIACGYDLRGIAERCPECGEAVRKKRMKDEG